MENCLFCRIIKGEIPCYRVYEDEDIIAFLDIAQSTLGHTLIVPKKHAENLLDVDPTLLQKAIVVAQKVAQKQMQTLPRIQGINLLNNCNPVSGQIIMHFHIHVLPRYEKGEMVIESRNPQKLSKDQFLELQHLIAIK